MKMLRWLSAVVCTALLCTISVTAAGNTPSAIARFSYDNTEAVPEENIEINGYGDKDKGYNATVGNGDLYVSVDGKEYRKLEWTKDAYSGVGIQPAMTGGARHPWGEGAFVEVRLSTVNWSDITFTARLGATNKGPRDYQLQYSLDGVTYKNLTEVVSLSDNKIMEQLFREVSIPAEANNAEMLYVRIAVIGNETVGGEQGFVGTTSGEVAINDISLYGVYGSSAADETAQQPWNIGDLPWLWIALGSLALTVVFCVARWAFAQRKAEKEEQEGQ